jgi:hypothetical protein
LRRRALLPRSLEHVALASAPVWRLTTARFESAIPATVIALDSHSRLLLDMGFVPAGTGIAWEPVGAWWYRDSQGKAYVGLWRQPRPPASVKHELRDAFADLENRRSPYDGVTGPIRFGCLYAIHVDSGPGNCRGNRIIRRRVRTRPPV